MTPETFSFFEVLEERTFPKDTLVVFLDEKAAYDLRKLMQQIDVTVEPTSAQVNDFKKRAEDLKARIEKSKYTFYLTGVSDDRIENAREVANAQFEDKKLQRKTATQSIERYLPESEQMNYLKFFNAVVTSLHIEQIVQEATGKVMTAPSPDEVANFMDKAPEAAKQQINAALSSLRVSAIEYERSLDEGFLAKS